MKTMDVDETCTGAVGGSSLPERSSGTVDLGRVVPEPPFGGLGALQDLVMDHSPPPGYALPPYTGTLCPLLPW